MTANQIAYHRALEEQRTNRANEDIKRAANIETARSNMARETETNRSNLAAESNKDRTLAETVRHNQRSEGQEDWKTAGAVMSGVGSLARGAGSLIPAVKSLIVPHI